MELFEALVVSGPHDVARSPAASVPGVAGGWWALLAGGWLLGLGPGPAACCPASEVTLSPLQPPSHISDPEPESQSQGGQGAAHTHTHNTLQPLQQRMF